MIHDAPVPTAITNRITWHLRQHLEQKQAERESNLRQALNSTNPVEQRKAAVAVRRNDKSIVLLVSKILCTHELTFKTFIKNGTQSTYYRCAKCKATLTRNP